jgi:hypothetical protein
MYSTECVHASHIQHMALTLFGHILSYATDISQVGVPVWYGVFVVCLACLYLFCRTSGYYYCMSVGQWVYLVLCITGYWYGLIFPFDNYLVTDIR